MHIDQLTYALSLITIDDAFQWLQQAVKGYVPSEPAVSRDEAMRAARDYLSQHDTKGVYTPIHTPTSAHVGLKTLGDNRVTAVMEADKQVMARNRLHPAGIKVPKVYGLIHTYNNYLQEDTIVLVMEHIEGTTYTHREDYDTRSFELLKALTASVGANHSDIHGDNIIVGPDGNIAIIDWGITSQDGRFRRWYKIDWGANRDKRSDISWFSAHLRRAE